jgi:hypothetical protein
MSAPMTQHSAPSEGPVPVDRVPMDAAYMGIPDEQNEAINDARRTFVITLTASIIFVAVVFVFIL